MSVTLSILQKLQILLVRVAIAPFLLMDLLAGNALPRSYTRTFAKVLLVGLSIGLIYAPLRKSSPMVSYNKNLSLWQSYVTKRIYGQPIQSVSGTGMDVLGTVGRRSAPVIVQKIAFPFITAKGHLVIDTETDKVLSEHNMSRTFAPASTTKLMTALVAVDLYSEGETVEISSFCSEVDSTKLWMPVGSKYTVRNMLYSLLVSSAGDAGCALAMGKVSLETFVDLMNKKAEEIGMTNTHFTNVVGLDGEEGSHYSSVWDLYLLSKKALRDPLIREIVRTKDFSFTDVTGKYTVNLSNTNQLLWDIPKTVGVKTGRTSGAGEVLIYRYQDEKKDFTIIVMSSEDRFLDTRNLINWTLSSYQWL